MKSEFGIFLLYNGIMRTEHKTSEAHRQLLNDKVFSLYPLKKIISIALDNTNVNPKLAKLLKELKPGLVLTLCLMHQLNLVEEHCFKFFPNALTVVVNFHKIMWGKGSLDQRRHRFLETNLNSKTLQQLRSSCNRFHARVEAVDAVLSNYTNLTRFLIAENNITRSDLLTKTILLLQQAKTVVHFTSVKGNLYWVCFDSIDNSLLNIDL